MAAPRTLLAALVAAGAVAPGACAWAQAAPSPPAANVVPVPPAAPDASAVRADEAAVDSAEARDDEDAPPQRRAWDATIGAVANHAPAYSGAASNRVRVIPGFSLRWGRVSFASRSAFVARGSDAGARGGLRVDLSPSDRFRVGLGLRGDSGRRESSSPELAGLGDIRRTLRVRLGMSYRLDDGWRIGSSVTTDALGRGGGTLGDLSAGRDIRLGPHTSLGVGATLTFGDRRYQQAYYGITPEQSARSGYPVYTPGAGLRDVGVGVGVRTYVGRRWVLFGGVNASQLLGVARDSPLTRRSASWGASAGVVYRF